MDLGRQFKTIREKRGLSIREVAALAGVSHGAISFLENSTRYPSLDTLEKLATALDLTITIGPKRTEIRDGV